MSSSPQPRLTPRIPPVGQPDPAQQAMLAKAPVRPDGTVRNLFLTLAHHPMLLQRFNAFAGTFFRSGLIPAYDRELVVLRVAARIGSRYEYGQHLDLAREAGMTDDTIRAVMLQEGAPPLAAADALIVDATDELLAGGDLGDDTWSRLASRFPEPALLELLVTIGFYRMTGDLLQTVGVALEEEPDLDIRW
jgi:alkylhydroperoxidase family enzyme